MHKCPTKKALGNVWEAVNLQGQSMMHHQVWCIKRNFLWAFFFNLCMIPLAAGVLQPRGRLFVAVNMFLFFAVCMCVCFLFGKLNIWICTPVLQKTSYDEVNVLRIPKYSYIFRIRKPLETTFLNIFCLAAFSITYGWGIHLPPAAAAAAMACSSIMVVSSSLLLRRFQPRAHGRHGGTSRDDDVAPMHGRKHARKKQIEMRPLTACTLAWLLGRRQTSWGLG